ncbi:MAG TPA: hypothetical protein VL155_10820 [Terriglobales bacterium]|nr:hypothetical protein [Terriglobales bacterium]
MVEAVIVMWVIMALTHSRFAAVAVALTVYAVEMLRPDTPREAALRRVLEKEEEQHLYYNLETKKWERLSDKELEERLELERSLEDGPSDDRAQSKTAGG